MVDQKERYNKVKQIEYICDGLGVSRFKSSDK